MNRERNPINLIPVSRRNSPATLNARSRQDNHRRSRSVITAALLATIVPFGFPPQVDAAHKPAAQKSIADRGAIKVVVTADMTQAAPDTVVTFTVRSRNLKGSGVVYLQTQRDGRWQNVGRSKFAENGTAKLAWLTDSSAVYIYRAVAFVRKKSYPSKPVMIKRVAPPSTDILAPNGPITPSELQDARVKVLWNLNQFRTDNGLSKLTLNEAHSDDAQTIARQAYLTGAPGYVRDAVSTCVGTTSTLQGPSAPSAVDLDPNVTSVSIGFYYDENGAWDPNPEYMGQLPAAYSIAYFA